MKIPAKTKIFVSHENIIFSVASKSNFSLPGFPTLPLRGLSFSQVSHNPGNGKLDLKATKHYHRAI